MSAPCPERGRGLRLPAVALAGLLLGSALRPTGPAQAGPLEAREAWQAAEALKAGAWTERVRALRRVAALAHPADPLHARALRAQARVLRGAARVHAAAALEDWAARVAPPNDPDRAAALITQARALASEGDADAARAPLEEAARVARRALPWQADDALDLLVEEAAERRDRPALERLAARLDRERARPSSRIVAWDRLGLLALAQGEEPRARACLGLAAQAYADAGRADPREAARATRAWLDAGLRARLSARPAGQPAPGAG